MTNTSSNLAELIKNGALIIDLRPAAEFEQGHIRGSLNIPFENLNSKLLKSNFVKFRKTETVIICSNSPDENIAAKNILLTHGMLHVYNGGIWKDLQNSLS